MFTQTNYSVDLNEVNYFVAIQNLCPNETNMTKEYVIKLYGSFADEEHYQDFLRDLILYEKELADIRNMKLPEKSESLEKKLTDLENSDEYINFEKDFVEI